MAARYDYLAAMSNSMHLPRCPHCGEPMRLARIIPRLSVHPELRSFECRPCGEAITEVVEPDS